MDRKFNRHKVEKTYEFSLTGLQQAKAEIKMDKLCSIYACILYVLLGYLVYKGVMNTKSIVTFITGNVSSKVVKAVMSSR